MLLLRQGAEPSVVDLRPDRRRGRGDRAGARAGGGSPWGFPLGLTLAVVPFVMMGYRYATKGRKFMPSGLLALDSLVVLGVMILVMDWAV
jgi:hypothetical protein